MSMNAPRLSGQVLRSIVTAMKLEPFRRAITARARKDLGIQAALDLDTSVRSRMPLDYRPLRARPQQVVTGELPLPAAP